MGKNRGPVPRPLVERIEKMTAASNENGCRLWIGTVAVSGYGVIRVSGQTRLAHRVAYEVYVGQIPAGLTLDHLCKTPLCVNPYHLEPTTNAVNAMRGNGPAAQNARKTHCPHGHPYSGPNLYSRRNGGRECRACGVARYLAKKQKT